MTNASSSPLDQLPELGDPDDGFEYLELGITEEHVPELIRIATRSFPKDVPISDELHWTRVHAWRALGQLRAEAAAEPLVRLLAEADPNDDWALEDLPGTLGLIGRAVIAPAREASQREESSKHSRAALVQAIREVGDWHRYARDEAVEALVGLLREWPAQSPIFNASLINELIMLNAVEAAPLMQAAIEANAVALEFTGNWEDVQEDLGMIRLRPRPKLRPADYASAHTPSRKPKTKVKNRRKDAKAARKRNRRG